MKSRSAAGYSGTPLAKKLGIGEGARVFLMDAPDNYVGRCLEPLPPGVRFVGRPSSTVDLAQIFVTRKEDLARRIEALRKQLRPEAAIWVSWPKKASKLPTTVTEDVVREVALPLGLVDVKVCAVTEVWSGLKLVVRKELR